MLTIYKHTVTFYSNSTNSGSILSQELKNGDYNIYDVMVDEAHTILDTSHTTKKMKVVEDK